MKILHVTFHRGCQYDIEYLCRELGLDLETLYFHDYAADIYRSNRYKITEQRAEAWWRDKKDYYQSFDLIITSDTAPLSRIFLQHIDELRPELIVWICNRFDYAIEQDLEYPRLLDEAAQHKRIKLIPNTEIERIYCKARGVRVTEPTIKPLGHRIPGREMLPPQDACYMEEADFETGFYVPTYHNETKFMNLHRYCSSLGVKTFHGIHRGADSLKRFKATIHIPYAWSTWAFFESLALNVPYLVPTERFLAEMQARPSFWFQTDFDEQLLNISEWYCPEHRDFLTYFDNWDDLAAKAAHTDWAKARERTALFAKDHHDRTIESWRAVMTPAAISTA